MSDDEDAAAALAAATTAIAEVLSGALTTMVARQLIGAEDATAVYGHLSQTFHDRARKDAKRPAAAGVFRAVADQMDMQLEIQRRVTEKLQLAARTRGSKK